MCFDDAGEPYTELMDLETLYLSLMSDVTDYEVSDDELVLRGPEFELRYERGTPP